MKMDIFYYFIESRNRETKKIITSDCYLGDIGEFLIEDGEPWIIVDYTWEFADLYDMEAL